MVNVLVLLRIQSLSWFEVRSEGPYHVVGVSLERSGVPYALGLLHEDPLSVRVNVRMHEPPRVADDIQDRRAHHHEIRLPSDVGDRHAFRTVPKRQGSFDVLCGASISSSSFPVTKKLSHQVPNCCEPILSGPVRPFGTVHTMMKNMTECRTTVMRKILEPSPHPNIPSHRHEPVQEIAVRVACAHIHV